MLKEGLFNTMMFVGNPDNYITCGLLTMIVAISVGVYRYRSFDRHDKEEVKDHYMSNAIGFFLAGLVWPITVAYTVAWLFKILVFFFMDADWASTKAKIVDRFCGIKRRYNVWRDVRMTKQAMAGKKVNLDTVYTNREYKIDLEK